MCLPLMAHVTETAFVKTTTFILMIVVNGMVILSNHQHIFSKSLCREKLRTRPFSELSDVNDVLQCWVNLGFCV